MKTITGYETNGDYVRINFLDGLCIIESEFERVLFADEQQADQYIQDLLNPKNKCKICGKDFEPNKYRKDQRFCGKECRYQHTLAEHKRRMKNDPEYRKKIYERGREQYVRKALKYSVMTEDFKPVKFR